jgi:flagellar protein FlgJ
MELNRACYNTGAVGRLETRAKQAEKSATGDSSFAELLAQKSAPSVPTPHSPLPTPHSPHIDKKSKLYKQCQELETFVVKILVDGMRKTVPKNDPLDTGFAGKMYEDMLYDKYSESLAKDAPLGFADLAYEEMTGQRGRLPDTEA